MRSSIRPVDHPRRGPGASNLSTRWGAGPHARDRRPRKELQMQGYSGDLTVGGVAALDPAERAAEKTLRLDAMERLGRHHHAGGLTAAELDQALRVLDDQLALFRLADLVVAGWAA